MRPLCRHKPQQLAETVPDVGRYDCNFTFAAGFALLLQATQILQLCRSEGAQVMTGPMWKLCTQHWGPSLTTFLTRPSDIQVYCYIGSLEMSPTVDSQKEVYLLVLLSDEVFHLQPEYNIEHYLSTVQSFAIS